MKTEYTSGPWLEDVENPTWPLVTNAVYVDLGNEELTILAEANNTGDLEGKGKANAQLISLAPTLVGVITALVREYCGAADTNRMDLYTSLPAEKDAIRILERLGIVKEVREAGCGGLRADWTEK
jgi:hypothetical protein